MFTIFQFFLRNLNEKNIYIFCYHYRFNAWLFFIVLFVFSYDGVGSPSYVKQTELFVYVSEVKIKKTRHCVWWQGPCLELDLQSQDLVCIYRDPPPTYQGEEAFGE